MLTSLWRSIQTRIWGCCALLALWAGLPAQAHNLDQRDTRISFDQPTLAMMAARAAAGQSLLQAGDVIGIVLKSTPGPGTLTGAGGYLTFYIPTGTQVMGADYGAPQFVRLNFGTQRKILAEALQRFEGAVRAARKD